MSAGSTVPNVLLYDANGNPIVLGSAPTSTSIPVAIATDQVAVATKVASGAQVDGHSASIGTTTDADTANTIIGRLKQLVTKVAGGLPSALIDGRLDTNIGAWLGSTVPTIGQKTGANSIPTVAASNQWPDVLAQAIFVKRTDGTNVAPTGDVLARSIFQQISDAVNGPVAVKPPSTAAVAADKSLVVTISPISAPLQVTTSGSGALTGDIFGRVLYGGSAGVLTVVRATAYTEQLANFTGSIKSANVNDAAAGTGMRTVKITYYDQTGAGPFIENVTLNGTTAVNLVNTDHCFIESIVGLTDGSLGTNAGIITLFTGAAGGGTAVGTIGVGNVVSAVGDGQTFWAHHYITTGKVASLFQLGAGTNGNQVGIAFLKRSFPLVSGNFEEQITDFIPFVNNGGYATRTLANPILITGFARITAYVVSNGTNTNFFANFDYSEV